ncbi:effector-associated constant component EACC1 [Amycolatopsis lurida]
MTTQLTVRLADSAEIGSLHTWLASIPDIESRPVARPARPGEQGDVWEFLAVLCGTGGAVTVAINAVATWIESKITHAKVRIGETEVELRGPDPEALARLVEAARKAAIEES